MTIQENRDDLIRRMIEQRKQCFVPPKAFLPSEEVRDIERYVTDILMPKVYEGKDVVYRGRNTWLKRLSTSR